MEKSKLELSPEEDALGGAAANQATRLIIKESRTVATKQGDGLIAAAAKSAGATVSPMVIGAVLLKFLLPSTDNAATDPTDNKAANTATKKPPAPRQNAKMIEECPNAKQKSSMPPSAVQKNVTDNKLDIDKAVKYLREKAIPNKKSTGWCTTYVVDAIQNGGGLKLDTKTWGGVSAKDWGPCLKNSGFSEVDINATDFKPEAGDVVIFDKVDELKDDQGNIIRKSRPHGHMQMWDGDKWISDFIQDSNIYPGSAYKDAKTPYKIYRYSSVNET